jgi:hypothetical protein
MLDSLIFDNIRLAVTGSGAVGDTLDRATAVAADLLPATLQDIQFTNLPTSGPSWLTLGLRSTLSPTVLLNRLTFIGTVPTAPTTFLQLSQFGTGGLTATVTNAVPGTPVLTGYVRRGAGTIGITWNGVVVP